MYLGRFWNTWINGVLWDVSWVVLLDFNLHGFVCDIESRTTGGGPISSTHSPPSCIGRTWNIAPTLPQGARPLLSKGKPFFKCHWQSTQGAMFWSINILIYSSTFKIPKFLPYFRGILGADTPRARYTKLTCKEMVRSATCFKFQGLKLLESA